MRNLLLPFFIFLLVAAPAVAQRKAKPSGVKIGEKTIAVRGTQFNQIDYAGETSKDRYASFYIFDAAKKSLVVTTVSWTFDDGKYVPSKVETITCPLADIDKENSYNIEMTDEAVAGGKYYRLTLVARGPGADILKFTSVANSVYADAPETKKVGFVTVNIISKTDADRWLKTFTSK